MYRYNIQNNTQHIGRITFEPKASITQDGKKRVALGLAIDMGKNQNGENMTTFINYSFWETSADFIERYCHKGDLVAVTGHEVSKTRVDPNTNQKIYELSNVGDSVRLLSRYKAENAQNDNLYQPSQNVRQNAQKPLPDLNPNNVYDSEDNFCGISDDDLPF